MEEPQTTVAERIVRELLGSPSTSNANITIQGATNWQLTSAMVAGVLGLAFGFFGLRTADKAESQTQAALGAMQQRLDQSAAQAKVDLAVMQRKLDRIEDYQTTSYMILPELRKQIEASLSKRKPKEQ